jgi:hypothetical protein
MKISPLFSVAWRPERLLKSDADIQLRAGSISSRISFPDREGSLVASTGGKIGFNPLTCPF